MNVIKAVFGGGRFAKTAPVFQWDTGDKLQFFGISLPANYQVHFASSFSGDAVTVLGDEGGVAIPSQFLQPGTEVYAWIWLSDSDGGYTKYQVTIPIYKRAKVTGQTPTPEQQSALDEAIDALNDAAEAIPEAIDAALEEAKESGEFDGEAGFSPRVSVVEISGGHRVTITDLLGPHTYTVMDGVDGQDGTDGYSPTVTVEEISGGHRVTIADAEGDHTFDVMDGTGGSGGTSDYNDLSNKPQIAGVTLAGNKTLAQIGAGTYSKPSGGIPATDLAAAVQTSLGKADTALQSVPSSYRTAAAQNLIDSEKIDKPSNPAVDDFLCWNGTTWAAKTVPNANGVSF